MGGIRGASFGLHRFARLLLCSRDCRWLLLWSATIVGMVALLSACLEDGLMTSTPVSGSMRSTLEAPGEFIYSFKKSLNLLKVNEKTASSTKELGYAIQSYGPLSQVS
jgi:hypothetical protein